MSITGVPAGEYGTKIVDKKYAKTWLVKFYKKTIFLNITSTTYEDQLQDGHSIKIRQKPTVTVNSYTARQDITFERPSTTVVEMDIDQALYVAVQQDDVETKQADMDNMSAWMEDGMKQLEITVEEDVFSTYPTQAAAANAGTTAGADSVLDLGDKANPVAITKDNITEYILRHAEVLDDQQVPDDDDKRNMVLPKWCIDALTRSPEFQDADKSGDDKTAARKRFVGTVGGMNIWLSQNLLRETDGGAGSDIVYNVFAAHKDALQFASQLKTEKNVDFESTFGKGDKMLFVYGRKATKDTGVTHGVIKRG